MDFDALSRPELQRLCKEHNIKANLSSKELIVLLQSSLASRAQQSHARERTRTSRATSAGRPLTHPVPPDEPATVQSRTRHSSRRSRTSSRSISSNTVPVITPTPDEEIATLESEKENKRDPERRKARESQKRLGVGKPRAAGGTGPRAVTRIVPSRSSTGGRTRSRMDIVQEAGRMEVVVEEDSDGHVRAPGNLVSPELAGDRVVQTITSPSVVQFDVSALSRRITAIESQISALTASRDSLLSKLAIQERGLVTMRGDTGVDKSGLVEDTVRQVEARFSEQFAEVEERRRQMQKSLDLEQQRVAKLEMELGSLAARLDTVESRSGGVHPDVAISRPAANSSMDLDQSTPLDAPEDSGALASTSSASRKRASVETPGVTTRASKRARHHHEPGHTYATAGRLEEALAEPGAAPVSPASAPATSVQAPMHGESRLPQPSQTPRTPPMTRNAARRQIGLGIPGSPRGGAPTPVQLRHMAEATGIVMGVGGMPPSPTTDTPRKGMKGKGKEMTAGGQLMIPALLASPVKVKGKGGTKAGAILPSAVPSSAPQPAGVSSSSNPVAPSTPIPSASQVRYPLPAESSRNPRAPSRSPAFPIYEPSSRYAPTRSATTGRALGLGWPSTLPGTTTHAVAGSSTTVSTSSDHVPPTALLPAFTMSPRRPAGQSTGTDDLEPVGSTPPHMGIGDVDDMLAIVGDISGSAGAIVPVTPRLSSASWGGGLATSPMVDDFDMDASPLSPEKRTLITEGLTELATPETPVDQIGIGGSHKADDWR